MDNATEIRTTALRAAIEIASSSDWMGVGSSLTVTYAGAGVDKVSCILADARKIEAYLLGLDGAANAKPAKTEKVDHMAAVREMARP